MSKPPLNQWAIGKPTKYAKKYIAFDIYENKFMKYTKKQLYSMGYNIRYIFTVMEISIDNRDYRHKIKQIIAYLPKITGYQYLGFHLNRKTEFQWRNPRPSPNVIYKFAILAFDQEELLAWRAFQETPFYLNLPKDIYGEILQYIYPNMIRILLFDISELWLSQIPILDIPKFLAKYLFIDDKFGIIDYWDYPAWSRKTNTIIEDQYPIVSEQIPTYTEINYPLL